MTKVLFALLRLGLGNSTPEDESLSDFIMLPAKGWRQIEEMSQKQGVLGIALDGVERLEATRYGVTRELSSTQKLEWIGQVMMIEQENRHQIDVMNELANAWVLEGCRVLVMKGQANGIIYPHPEHRTPGDIDCYLFSDYNKGNEIARRIGAKVDDSWYKHSQICYKGELIENHQFFVHTRHGKRSKRLQQELVQKLEIDNWNQFPDSNILLPPIQWNAMFLTYHACAHFISEGLRLKQLLDWAIFLKQYQNNIDWNAFYEYCERFHFRRFVDAITTICVENLGVNLTNPIIVANSTFAEKVLLSIFEDTIINRTGGWNERFQILKNLFQNRWKYKDIYEDSTWKQLWYYAAGFLFKTE